MKKTDRSDNTIKKETGSNSRAAQRAQEAAKQVAAARQKVLLIALAIALLVNAALAYFLHDKLVADVQRQRLLEVTQQQTQMRAENVEKYLQQLNQSLLQVAQQPQILSALTSSDLELVTQQQLAIAETIEDELAVRLIPAGSAKLDRQSSVPIRFAELDLIRRAEDRQSAFPEVAKIDNRWLLHWITPLPIESQQPVAGTLMITLDSAELIRLFSSGDSSLGQSVLLQKFSDTQPLAIAQHGEGNAAASHEVAIPASNWSVKFTPSQQLVKNSAELPTLWLLIISLTSVAGLVGALLASKILVKPYNKKDVAPAKKSDEESAVATDKKIEEEPMLTNPMYQSQDILDITVIEEDDDILGLNQAADKKASASSTLTIDVPTGIFRSYDIRGVVDAELTLELAEQIGKALGSEVLDSGDTQLIVARDGRTHSDALSDSLISGILSTGCHVIDIGVAPTPVLYFATFHMPDTSSGVMVTASHNPAKYNGFKMMVNGVTLADDAVMAIRSRIINQEFHSGQGQSETREIFSDYIDRIFSDVALAGNISMVIDAGNAVTGIIAPQLFEELGCDVTPLYCELDGTFPNHEPDPCQEHNLADLIAKVQEVNADIGVAFDGDGDRLVVVTPQGKIIWPDQLLMLFARDVLSRNPGADILFDVKCSRQLNQVISSYGGRPIMWKTGHSPMKAKMIETGALIGGEYSGHIFIKDRWYGFDDGMYAMARLLEIVTLRDQGIDDIFAAFPILPATPELKISVPDAEKFSIVQQLVERGDFATGKLTTIDGLRVDFSKGWGLVRASNTSAALTLRFEAETREALIKIQQLFKRELIKVNPDLKIDF